MKIFLFHFTFLISVAGYATTPLDSLLNELDHTIHKREEFLKKKQERISAIKIQLPNEGVISVLNERYSILNQLFEEYKTFVYDSAFNYGRELLHTAYLLKQDSLINQAKVKVSFTLLSAGMFKEALDTLHSVDINSLSRNAKIDYYATLGRTYFDLADYSNDEYFSEHYDREGISCLKKALELSSPHSMRYLLLKGLEYMRVRDTVNAIKTFKTVLQKPGLSIQESAIASSSLSYMYRLVNEPKKAKEYLAKAAIADIISCTRETVAIRDLAEVLYNEGDVDRSYKYVKIALEDAYFYGAKYRKIQISNILPIIEGTQLEMVQGQKRRLFYYSIIATILAVFVIVFALIIYRQFKKLKAAKFQLTLSHKNLEVINARLEDANFKLGEFNNKLEDANKIKEEYIGSFFKLISDYLEKLEKFKNTIDRKMSQKKLEDVKDLVNNMNLKPEREQLYLTFDKTFLKIFPGFVDQFNCLFNPQDQFNLNDKQGLSTELRIFALIRLGITDNEKIAKILDYSVNTIYTYKTRVKNKSIVENEKFEDELMKIRTI